MAQGKTTPDPFSPSNRDGVWLVDRSGRLSAILRTGQTFDVNEDPNVDDLRTIQAIDMIGGSGGEDGRPVSINDADQVALRLSFTDGSQAIVVATIPEPGSLAITAFAGLGLLGIRPRTSSNGSNAT
ncbi:MAG: hypothetical protein ACE37H_06675 [Phycisphaeraceae bacterium]